MKKNICFIQARMNSSRLPGKSMLNLGNKTLLGRVIESVQKSKVLDDIVVVTSIQKADDLIAHECKQLNVNCFRGNLNNVLLRFYEAAKKFPAEYYFRITADNPLTPAFLIEKLSTINSHSYMCSSDIPKGTKVERFSKEALESAFINARDGYDKEHVTPYIIDHFEKYELPTDEKMNVPNLSATIDTLEDYLKIAQFYNDNLSKKESPEILEFINYMPMISSEK